MASSTLDAAITSALDELNGTVDYNEKEIVDEVVTAKQLCLVLSDTYDNIRANNDNEVFTAKVMTQAEKVLTIFVNYRHLLENGVDKSDAMKISVIRVGLLANGALLPSSDNPIKMKYTYIPEVRIVDIPSDAKYLKSALTYKTDSDKDVTIDDTPKNRSDLSKKGIDYKVIPATVSVPDKFREFNDELKLAMDKSIIPLVKYLPIFAHMAFTKFNHHYLNNDFFKTSYEKQFKSLQLNEYERSWNKQVVIYNAIHWMGPYAMKLWVDNIKTSGKMPRALEIKFPLIPAGTALIASTVAVLKAASALPGFSAFFQVFDDDWLTLTKSVALIKASPYQYHIRADLFGLRLEEEPLAKAKVSAVKLSPAAQAFINKYAMRTDMARIQSIDKHAKSNAGLLQMYEALFGAVQTKTKRDANTRPLEEIILGTAGRASALTAVIPEGD